jgi:serine/threonine protein kinase
MCLSHSNSKTASGVIRMSDLEGAVISGYLLQQCLSQGGVADIYHAHPLGRDTEQVVVKIFRHEYVHRSAFRDYFLSEAEKIAHLKHPHVLPLIQYGQETDLLYVVMPSITTGNLDDLLMRVGGRLSAMQALPIIQQLCSALTYTHEQQLIHGNLKPQNILVAPDGRMLLADFGIMRSFDDSQQSLTRIGWGSAEYASPEQSLGIQHHGSDIYSLGVVLFRILAGVPPFTGQTPVEVLLKHVRQPAPLIRTLVPTISEPVETVLMKALKKRADERYTSAKDFYAAFQDAVTLAPIASPVARSITRTLPAFSEHPEDQTQRHLSLKKLSLQAADPTTPIPVSLALDRSVQNRLTGTWWRTEVPHEKSELVEVVEQKQEEFQPSPSDNGSLPSTWSSEPPEWSPIVRGKEQSEQSEQPEQNNVPNTAQAYLQQMDALEEEEASSVGTVAGSELAKKEIPSLPFATFLQQWLPFIVVAFLLLGLLGALASALFLR